MLRAGILFALFFSLSGFSSVVAEEEAVVTPREQRLMRGVYPSVKNASVIVIGRVVAVNEAATLELEVQSVIWGKLPKGNIKVGLKKAAFGHWPKAEDNTILCLVKKGKNYELASYYASILPPTDAIKAKIQQSIKKVESAPKEPTVKPVKTKTDNPYKETAKEAQTILAGGLTGIAKQPDGSHLAVFKVDKSYLGFEDFRAPLRVRFAASFKAASISSGRYILFLKESKTGADFDVISLERLGGEKETAMLASVIKAVGKNKRSLTSFKGTLASWENAWKQKDVEKIIRCYSKSSPRRKEYDKGEETRKAFAAQVASFNVEMTTSVKSYKESRRAIEGTRFKSSMLVRVAFTLRYGDDVDTRIATMTFVEEDGEWLIFDEGL